LAGERLVRFSIWPELLDRRPDYIVGIVVARQLDNGPYGAEAALREIRQAEAWRREQPEDNRSIELWRQAQAQLGIDPSQHPPAVERLLDRVRQGESLPSVNPAVDLANAVALRHGVSLGAHDLDQAHGDITVRLAHAGDTFLPYDGEQPEPVTPGEPVYADDRDVRTRWWISRQSRRGRVEPDSRTLFFPIDGFMGATDGDVRAAMEELAA